MSSGAAATSEGTVPSPGAESGLGQGVGMQGGVGTAGCDA